MCVFPVCHHVFVSKGSFDCVLTFIVFVLWICFVADERQRSGGPAVSHPLPLCCSVWFWVWPANFVFQTLIQLKRGHLQAGEEVTPPPPSPRLASPRPTSQLKQNQSRWETTVIILLLIIIQGRFSWSLIHQLKNRVMERKQTQLRFSETSSHQEGCLDS